MTASHFALEPTPMAQAFNAHLMMDYEEAGALTAIGLNIYRYLRHDLQQDCDEDTPEWIADILHCAVLQDKPWTARMADDHTTRAMLDFISTRTLTRSGSTMTYPEMIERIACDAAKFADQKSGGHGNIYDMLKESIRTVAETLSIPPLVEQLLRESHASHNRAPSL